MSIVVTLHDKADDVGDYRPSAACIEQWVAAAVMHHDAAQNVELGLCLVNEVDSQALNERYRDVARSTNVLAFPAQLPAVVELPLLGDLVICPAVLAREAEEQHKTLPAHWAHMLIHGSLHLLGYVHSEPAQAAAMESLETTLLADLGFPDPY